MIDWIKRAWCWCIGHRWDWEISFTQPMRKSHLCSRCYVTKAKPLTPWEMSIASAGDKLTEEDFWKMLRGDA